MKLVVIEPLSVEQGLLEDIAREALGDRVEIVWYPTRADSDEELIERGRDADIVLVANQSVSAGVIEGWEKCRYLSVAFTGVDHIAMDTARARGITVTNAAGYSNAAVAELVFGMLISWYRNIAQCDSVVRAGGTKEGLVGPELEGKKFGIVGLGAIGSRVAKVALAFGCEVYAYQRHPSEMEGIRFVSLEELLANCDIVSLHVPSNDETRHLIDASRLRLMKPTAILINCARGPVVDNEALMEALNEGVIAGALIDVFDMEPPLDADYPLLHAEHTLLTPHVAFATDEAFVKRARIVFDNIAAYLDGAPRNVV